MSRSMKDSGIEWIGEIPCDWEVSINKTVLQNVSVRNHPDAEVLSLYRDWGVIPKNSRDDNHNVTSEKTEQYKFVESGDLVINKMKAWQGSLAVSEYEGIVSPAYYVCKFKNKKMDKKYIHHLLRSCVYAQQFECLSTGMRIGQWDLSIDDFLSSPLLIPSKKEQVRIAKEIDDKCTQVDTLISNQQKQIEKLQRYKQTLITETVTKGLSTEIELKDSGVEWIGEIPSHWNQATIGRLCFVTKLAGFEYTSEMNGKITETGEIPIVRAQNIKMGKFIEPTDSFISTEISSKLNRCALDKKCLLITFIGAGIGEVAIFDRKTRYHLAPNVAKIVINNEMKEWISEEFLMYFMMSTSGQEEVNKIKKATAQPSLSMQTIRSIAIVIPPLEEQVKISGYLGNKCKYIDDLIAIKEQKIEKLQQYKKSIIYEYVTGKKETL